MIQSVILFILLLNKCSAVIYYLNDTEHARMPPLIALDQYESCLRDEGTYCVVRLSLFADPTNDLIKLIHEYSAYTVKHYNYTFVDRGICVEKTCKKFIDHKNVGTKDLEGVLERCTNDSMWENYGLQSRVTQVFNCDRKDENEEPDFIDQCVLGAIILLLMLSLFATFYDIYCHKIKENKNNNCGNKFLLCFSIIKNWEWMVSSENNDPRIDALKGFYGAKSVTTLFVILAHAMFVISIGFSDNPHEFEKGYELAYYQIIFNGMAIVQVFFVMSGFLLVYNMQIYSEQNHLTWKSVPKILFYRWWRLTPAYAVVVALTATWLRHLGSGPVWGLYVKNSVVADCRNYWWLHLLYLNNFQPEDKFCLLQTWHIGADMHLFILGLLVHMATLRRGRRAVLVLLLVAGTLAPAMQVWLQDLDGVMLLTPETYRSLFNDTYKYLHVQSHNNIACYAIGMAAGHWVHQMQKKNTDLKQYKALPYLCWFVIPALIGLLYSGRMFYVDGDRASMTVRMLYAATHRVLIGAVVGFACVVMVMKSSGFIQNLFEWRGWLVPGKLSYAVYLLHMNMVHILIGSKHRLIHVSFFYMIINYFGIVMLSFILAVPFYILVEAPMVRLMKVATGGSRSVHDRKKRD